MRFIAFLLSALVAKVHCDVYLHMPRGGNNRLDEANRDRNNGNRLFDSQNNNRGGNNVGQVYYYEGSEVPFEWTNQHSCGGPNNNCELIVQYMCDDRLRDGTTTKTIPTKPIECYNWDCDTDVRYGRHESFDYYMMCANRQRNMGLFTADQKLKGNTAKYTRQNPNGARRGYECPEERDYYPYWGPSPWRDIAIFTNQPERCPAYREESQNRKPRFFCDVPYTAMKNNKKPIPITQQECEEIDYYDKNLNQTVLGNWTQVEAFGVEPPTCSGAWPSRDNHLGNVKGGHTSGFNWTVPSDWIHEQCVIRLRYNISTGDIPHFDPENPAALEADLLTSVNNGDPTKGKKGRAGPSNFDVASAYGINTEEDVYKREYVIENNPQVDIWGELMKKSDGEMAMEGNGNNMKPKVRFQLAINTAQYGRVFQDRTHKFAIRKRPAALGSAKIHNLQVRGKRGNVVQTYPGTEYDFSPNRLACKNGDYVHFQWTGSNTNPNNNAGQGKQGTDRHNVVMLRNPNYEEQGLDDNGMADQTYGHFGNSYPANIDDDTTKFLGFSNSDMQHLAVLDTPGGQFGGELSELDDAGTYFDLGPKVCKDNGVYHYMCTRNNNFSNRSEKAKIVVQDYVASALNMDVQGGKLVADSAMLWAPQGAMASTQTFSVISYDPDHETSFEGDVASMYVEVSVQNAQTSQFNLEPGKSLTLTIDYEHNPIGFATVWRAEKLSGEWTEMEDAEFNDGKATLQIQRGGYYVVETTPAYVAIVFISLAVAGVLGAVGWLIWKKMRPSNLATMRNGV
jgi:plastocyanin